MRYELSLRYKIIADTDIMLCGDMQKHCFFQPTFVVSERELMIKEKMKRGIMVGIVG